MHPNVNLSSRLMSKIENGHAIPPIVPKYPWRKMKARQSFTVTTEQERNSALHIARVAGIQATSRKLSKNKFRLWRIA